MVGFAAATYLRGIPVVHVPTTLLAQVDSAIGGKTGVNHPLGKNLIGAFHPPSLVVADPVVLETLPRREFRAGLYEVIKYGVISDPALLDRMRDTLPAIFARDGDAVAPLVSASCRIKAQVVSADERESGLRRILNFGHTVGPRAGSGDQVQAVPPRRGDRLRHAGGAGDRRGARRDAAVALRGSRGADHAARPAAAGRRHLGERGARRDRPRQESGRTAHCISSRPSDRGKTIELTDVTEKEIKAALKKIGLSA